MLRLGQSKQAPAALPIVSLYVPFWHDVHTPPSGPVYPAWQRHASGAVLATRPCVLEWLAHAVQEALPISSLKVSAKHEEHPCPVNPASHTHLEANVWAVSPCVPELGMHSVQGDEPFSVLNVPASHAVQFAPAWPALHSHRWSPTSFFPIPAKHGTQPELFNDSS